MADEYIVTANARHPENLADGRTVAAGDRVTGVDADGDDKRLIDEGILVKAEPEKKRSTSATKKEDDK